jgi:hypothetical protein
VMCFNHIKETNQIEVVFREPSNRTFFADPTFKAPDRVWKEIYGVVDGVITLIQTIEGKVVPPQNTPETISFD